MTFLSAGVVAGIAGVPGRAAWAQSAEKNFSIDIEAMSLVDGLKVLQKETGARFVFSPDQLRGAQCGAVSGELTLTQALALLLTGTGFEAQMTGESSYLIVGASPGVSPAQVTQGAATKPPPPAPSPDPIDHESISEVVVTAQRREEDLQVVPISMQALTATTLNRQQAIAFDDYAKLLPSVSSKTLGPGRTDIFFRGISTGAAGLLPATGMYLDDIPVTTGGRALDLHLYDISRVEALSGPQGTLYGANSLAGTIRVITNKPDPSHYSAGVTVQGDKYGGGDGGGMVEGFTNIPLSQTAAVRLVGFYENDGGYIDNKPATLTYHLGDNDPNTQVTINNAAIAKNNFNPAVTYGGRATVEVALNDSWTLTPQVLAQWQDAKGSFLYDPRIGDLAVHDFTPTRNRDEWYQAAMTIEGHVGILDIIYSGGYLARNIADEQDYTYYTVAYDHVPGYTKFPNGHGGYLDPTQRYYEGIDLSKQTHELRVSTGKENRFHFTSGLFFQRTASYQLSNYYVPGLGATGNPIAVYGDDVFLISTNASNTDYAVFAEGTYEITPDVSLTAGVRGFIAQITNMGFIGTQSAAHKAGCGVPLMTPGACQNTDQHLAENGQTHKVNLTWQIAPDTMIYTTYSTGFRPGGPNNLPTVKPFNADTLDNYEVGYKTIWFGRLRLNGAFYYEVWNGLQYRLVVPGNNGEFATYNAGQAHVFGAETDGEWLVTKESTLAVSSALNDARLSKNLCNLDSTLNPLPTCSPGPTTAAPKGTRLPSQPEFKFSGTARYEVPMGSWRNFIQASLYYQTSTRSYLSTYEDLLLGDTPGFATVDFSIGAQYEHTTLTLFVENAFDNRGQLSRDTLCAIEICTTSARIYPIKPQFFGVKVEQIF